MRLAKRRSIWGLVSIFLIAIAGIVIINLRNSALERKVYEDALIKRDTYKYLRKYGRQGKYYDLLMPLMDSTSFERAAADNNVKGYTNYINVYPDGQFVSRAKERLASLDDSTWSVATRKKSYKSYLKSFPNGRYCAEANNRLALMPITFKKTYGKSGYYLGNSVQQTMDGGYIMVGYGGSERRDVYLAKADSTGNLEWEETYGGDRKDEGESVQQTSDGGYILAGVTNALHPNLENDGSGDVYLAKIDDNGNLMWEKVFGGNRTDKGKFAIQTSEGGYIIVGSTESYGNGAYDVYMIKTDSKGDLIWEKTFGGKSDDFGESIDETFDGGFIIAGITGSKGAGGHDYYLVKLDKRGNLRWERTFGGRKNEFCKSVQQTSDGGYILVGTVGSAYGTLDNDVRLVKTDGSGNLIWKKTYGGGRTDRGESVQQTSDGGYIIGGNTSSKAARNHVIYLIKTDVRGNLQWEKRLGGSYGSSVQQTSDGGYVIIGNSGNRYSQSILLIKTDPLGYVYN